MSEPNIRDLDILRPQPDYVRLAGRDIDVSFIPSGIAMDVMQYRSELAELTDTPEKLALVEAGGAEARRTFEIGASLCAAITQSQHPEMDKEWLLRNTSVLQIKALMECVTEAIFKSLETAEDPELKKQ
jgi:hypothetical protein